MQIIVFASNSNLIVLYYQGFDSTSQLFENYLCFNHNDLSLYKELLILTSLITLRCCRSRLEILFKRYWSFFWYKCWSSIVHTRYCKTISILFCCRSFVAGSTVGENPEEPHHVWILSWAWCVRHKWSLPAGKSPSHLDNFRSVLC